MVALIAFLSAPLIHEDGSCWTAHGFSEAQKAELQSLQTWVPAKVQVLEALPEGWTPAPPEAPGGEG